MNETMPNPRPDPRDPLISAVSGDAEMEKLLAQFLDTLAGKEIIAKHKAHVLDDDGLLQAMLAGAAALREKK